MDYLSFFINKISLEVDFYNNEAYAGNSILPFMGFMMFLIGLVVVIVGPATYFTAKNNFNIFHKPIYICFQRFGFLSYFLF